MLSLFFLLCACLAFASSARALAIPRTVSGFPDPLVDPFYSQPKNIASYSLGQVITTRSTVSTFAGASLEKSYQIKFRSTNAQNQAIAAITTVLVPTKKTLTSSGHASMLSFQNFEDAVSLSCSPSWAYVANSGSAAALEANLEAPIVNGWALDAGYYVVIPDHEGPNSSFIAGTNAGHIVLDSIRAALTEEKLSLTKTQIGMYGYSGGANAGVFASSLAPGYAPELNVVGVSIGGTPVSPQDTFYKLNGGFASGLAGAGAIGIASAYPDVQTFLNTHVNAQGKPVIAGLKSDNTCVGQVTSDYGNINFFDLVTPNQDFLLAAPARKALAKETLLQTQASYTVPVPKHPVYIYHALLDELVPFNSSQLYIQEQCAGGANIRSLVFPVGGHITTEILGIPTAIAFLSSAFEGTLDSVVCGTLIPEVTLGSAASVALLGSSRDSALQTAHNDGLWDLSSSAT